MSENDQRLYQLSGDLGEVRAELREVRKALDELSTAVKAQQETTAQIRLGGRIAVVLLGLFGGAAGGKLAHIFGFFSDSAQNH